MSSTPDPLGLIAGNRSLPLMLARQARAMGVPCIAAVAFDKETDPALVDLVDHIEWVKVGQLNKMIEGLKRHNVRQCVMAGQIAPKNLFDVRPDLRAMGVLMRLKQKNAHTIFGAVADELRKDGIELITALPWLEPLMPGEGFSLGKKVSEQERQDIQFGFGIAKEISRLEIGQSVVVKEGTVLAVEGFEGTDQCLARGGELAGKSGGAVAVKVARENHDMRFDIPCMGERTVRICAENGIRVLAIESGRSLILDQEEVEKVCRKNGVSVVTVSSKK